MLFEIANQFLQNQSVTVFEDSSKFKKHISGNEKDKFTLQFHQSDTSSLPLKNNSVRCILVDPPWGHRHSNHSFVQKNWHPWKREWHRVLEVGGILGIFTIRSNHVLHEWEQAFQEKFELVEKFLFDNAGFRQCCFFAFRKI